MSDDSFKARARELAVGITCAYLFGVLVLVAFLDAMAALTYTWLFTGPAILAGLLIALPTLIIHKSKPCAMVLVISLTAILLIRSTDFTPVKPYKRFYASVETGMTPVQVLLLLDREFPKNGKFNAPVVTRGSDFLQLILDPNNGAYNAEVIQIDVRSGKVADKRYLPD